MPEKLPRGLKIPSPDARSAFSPFGARTDFDASPLFFSTGGAASVGLFTLVINILNTETLTIDGKVYTFQDTLTDVDGNVHIGSTAEDTLDNWLAAINRSNEGESSVGPGTDYALAMTEHPTVSAVDGAGLTVDITAKSKGTLGDDIDTTEAIVDAGAVWGGATLGSGADPDAEAVFIPVVQWSSMRIRLRVTGSAGVINAEFARPAGEKEPNTDGTAFVYTEDIPAIDGTAWVDGVELSLEITDVEHQGENWLKLSLTSDSEAGVVDFGDISGELYGNFH